MNRLKPVKLSKPPHIIFTHIDSRLDELLREASDSGSAGYAECALRSKPFMQQFTDRATHQVGCQLACAGR